MKVKATSTLLGAWLGIAGATLAGETLPQPPIGSPLLELSAEELARFASGRALFTSSVPVAAGLGPVFNKASCVACHGSAAGGIDVIGVFYIGSSDGSEVAGGPLFQSQSISAECAEFILGGDVLGFRLTTSVLGAGLVEAIPDAAILALADPNDTDGDGISGRARMVAPVESPRTMRVGRFGWKSRWATVLSASASEAQQEIGLTNRYFPSDDAPGGDEKLLGQCDNVPDPEDIEDSQGLAMIDRVTEFQRFLAAPPQAPRGGMSGEAVFAAIGCARCHVPTWTTADDPALSAALRSKVIRPYSDFLLHDMGFLGDGFPEGDSDANELRTSPLWNLRRKVVYLHNGSVNGGSFEGRMFEVILNHGPFGEGAESAQAFLELAPDEQEKLITFLDSLGRLDFDADGNDAIDLADFAALAACFGATDVTPDDPCGISDVDQDGTIGLVDAELFVASAGDLAGDCDGDGVDNLIEILLGAADRDGDGVPDQCGACVADLDGDGTVGSTDLATLLGAWGGSGADLDDDLVTGSSDLATLLGAWGDCD